MKRLFVVSALVASVASCQAKSDKSDESDEAKPEAAAKTTAPPVPTGAPAALDPTQFVKADPGEAWWAAPEPCPAGASVGGAPPPKGFQVFCALPDGTMHGRVTKFGKLGGRISQGTFVNGKKHGTFIAYHGNGKPSMNAEFVDGKENGPVTAWHANGQKALEGTYKDGKGAGPWKKWDADGKLIAEGDYSDTPAEKK